MFCPKCGAATPPSAAFCGQCGQVLTPSAGPSFPPLSAGQDRVPENLATLGQRLMGQFLDSVIAFIPVLAALVLGVVSDTLGGLALLGAIAFAVFYILFADGFEGGQSFGKRMMGTAVISAATGQPCSYGASLIRNLLLSLLGFIDWLFIFGPRRQRLGDKAAGTYVVRVA